MPDLHHAVWIDAEPGTVFKAVSTDEGFASWWTANVQGEAHQGRRRFTFGFDGDAIHAAFETVERSRPKRIVLSCTDGIDDWQGTQLIFELEPQEGGTFLRFDHVGWREADWYFRSCNSIWGHLMYYLKAACEEGVSEPFFQG